MNSFDEVEAVRNFADCSIREMLEDADNLRELLQRVLHDAAKAFDYSKRRILPRDFLLPNWRGRERDFLCEIPYRTAAGERDALVCVLIEHQTQPDARMPLRTLIYTVFYWEQCLRAWESSATPRGVFRLPTVVPIVLHASPRCWTGPRTLAEMLDDPAVFHPFAPKWEPLFWEVGEHGPEELLNSGDAFLQVLAIVRVEDAEREEALAVYREMLTKVAGLHEQNAMRWTHLLRFALGWVVNRRPPSERNDWLQATEESQTNVLAKEEIRNMGKTIAQSWVEEGIEIGRANTLLAVLVEIGAKRFGEPSENIRSALQSISDVERLERLFHKILDVSSWSELLQDNSDQ